MIIDPATLNSGTRYYVQYQNLIDLVVTVKVLEYEGSANASFVTDWRDDENEHVMIGLLQIIDVKVVQ